LFFFHPNLKQTSINLKQHHEKVKMKVTECIPEVFPLDQDQIDEFVRNGVLVVENVFQHEEIEKANQGLKSTLKKYGVDINDLENTGHRLRELSSTNGSGGVLDIFYPKWKLEVALHPKFFSIISQLWEASFHHKEKRNGSIDCERNDAYDPKAHPFGPFDFKHGYIYMDRIGYRIPTALAQTIGVQSDKIDLPTTKIHSKKNQRKQNRPIQRSLTPHLDCCPETILQIGHMKSTQDISELNLRKWRPLQSFISLTDNDEPNTGGFEAVPGFHHEFYEWAKNRKPSIIMKKGGNAQQIKAPCIGEYTHIRPKEDSEVFSQIQPIPCKAGSVVIWDNRIPHSNSFRNDSDFCRAVIYASFLPDIELNRQYLARQLDDYLSQPKRIPTDQWIKVRENRSSNKDHVWSEEGTLSAPTEDEASYDFSPWEKKLMGIHSWD